jgi:hypothetical protein
MRKFTLKPGLSFAVIPGTGRVSPKQVLEGEQYARFVPSLLAEVLVEPAPIAPPLVVRPPPLPAPRVEVRPPPPPPPVALAEVPVSVPAPALVEVPAAPVAPPVEVRGLTEVRPMLDEEMSFKPSKKKKKSKQ